MNSTITSLDNPPWSPHRPVPYHLNKPALTSSREVINMAYSGDLLHKDHVRQWFYDQHIIVVTNQAMQWFIDNKNLKQYVLEILPSLMEEYGINIYSNAHHFGTAFEAEYYTNPEFVGYYWRKVRLPTKDELIQMGCSFNYSSNTSIVTGALLPEYYMNNRIGLPVLWQRLVNISQSSLLNVSVYDNVILSYRMVILAVTHFWVTVTSPFPDGWFTYR